MLFDIWLLPRGRLTVGYLPNSHYYTRGNWLFSTLVRLFSEIFCLPVCLYIPLFLKEIQQFVWKHYRASLEDIILGVQMHKIVFTPGSLPRRFVLRYIFSNFCVLFPCLLFCIVMIFYVSQFLENHSITSHQFVSQMYLVLLLGLFWGYDILFLRAVLPYLMKFCTYVICITMPVNTAKKYFTAPISLLGALCCIFGLILGIVLSVLRNLRDSLIFCTNVLILLCWSLN